ncbi:hypothetical protein CWE09_08685 [Aliidiomarina minuta]|uniref:AEC family transporter n=1 Tax=Aliidiomarina minuta TaxID=880057 RepID=A0A432W9U8_9GAMM|nr:AEC family transporter [Aliidiomarina minuta]RUO26756.1 hypothetical protein CWE09_08685 [Aliidiomarina minuta]
MSGFAVVLSFLLAGYLLQKLSVLPEKTGPLLNKYVVNVAVPAMVLLHVPRLTIDSTLWVPLITPWAMLILSALLVLLLAHFCNWSREVTGALMVVVPLGNTSFLGFPIIESFYGTEGLVYAVLYDQLGSFIGLALYATFVASWYAKDDDRKNYSATQLLLQILRFPPFIALLLATILLFSGSQYPLTIEQIIGSIAATLVPVVMIAVGLQLRLSIPRQDISPFVSSLGIKLILMPLLALSFMLVAGLDGLAVKVSLLEAAMPPMITAGAIAMAAGLRPPLVSAIIGYGVLFSVLSIPAWYWIIETLIG